ncbi:hypothetical protein IH992_28160, partial [Candidatus Poribacteria bacterium]|nr:hypothetical protein [Candidatus Poribacteria bacterium]
YDRTGTTSVAWLLTADSLQAAARILKAHRDRFDPTQLNVGDNVPDEGKVLFPELMLKGFAVENLLKALWLKHGNKLAVGGKYVGIKGAANHDLLQLADTVGLHFNRRERDVLKRLSIIMTSSGRYPIPRDWSARRIQKLHGGGKGIPTFWQCPTDDQTLEGVVESLEKEFDE